MTGAREGVRERRQRKNAKLREEVTALDTYADDRVCSSCEASIASPGDTLCAECRAEIDRTYADLPGAQP